MASLRVVTHPFSPGFAGGRVSLRISDLETEKFHKLMPLVNELVLGMPAAQPLIRPAELFGTDTQALELVITHTYVSALAGYAQPVNKINMIKFFRSVTLWGLKDSKDFVDRCELNARSYVPAHRRAVEPQAA